MVKAMNLKSLIQRIQSIIADLNGLYKASKSPANYGKSQEINRRITLCKGKLRDYLEKVNNAGQGNIIIITYEILEHDNRKYTSTYINISKEDAKNLLEFRYMVKGLNIKILEIKETFTKIENPIL